MPTKRVGEENMVGMMNVCAPVGLHPLRLRIIAWNEENKKLNKTFRKMPFL